MPTEALRQASIAILYAAQLFGLMMKNKNDLLINMGGEIADNLGDIVYINAVPLRLMHLFPAIQPKSGIEWRMYGRIFTVFLRTLGNSTAAIVANSKFTQALIRKHLGKRAFVIYPPVTTRKIGSRAKTKERKNLVVTIARFRSAKRLNIIPKIAACAKNCEFALIGIVDNGSEQCLSELSAEIKKLKLQERVHIFGNMPYEFTLKTLSKAKVFLQTQSTEAFGMSVVEAMAAGCVPLVPRMGGPWIDILDSQEGLYGFSYENINDATEKIKSLIDNETLRSEVSARATERAKVFDSSVFEQKLCHIAKTMIWHNKSPLVRQFSNGKTVKTSNCC
ncbi:MAG: glycosyltransferase [Candidatus Bathyarchaeota archaeon]|nr:glycosyltransferase [Candidatus Bathyarchaeota archaeon]